LGAVHIADVIAVPVTAAFFFDDQAAIRAGAQRDGLTYPGTPLTPGFERIRQPATAVSVLLVLSDGQLAHGDCVSVQYAGVGGREPLLDAPALAAQLEGEVADELRGRPVGRYEPFKALLDDLGKAAAYGLSQALLDACARANRCTMAELVRREWGLGHPLRPVPVFAQTGEDRHAGVEKMILKRVDSLPHGLINTLALVGPEGRELLTYVRWIRDRIQALVPDLDYRPILHFDTYATLGLAFDGDLARVAELIVAMEAAAHPYALRVEHPVDAGGRAAQIRAFVRLRELLAGAGSKAQLVADEWANTVDDIRAFNRAHAADVVQIKAPDLGPVGDIVDAVLDCRAHGVVAHLGGSCCETERSAQVSVHLALGSGADQLLAKPGMGVDEGLSVVRNEMARTLALAARRNACTDP
jgi:methylaspartate ammonia-lyase